MKTSLRALGRVGAWASSDVQGGAPICKGPADLGGDFYVPAPGRVQYYRAECLPFVPDEVKCQLRFPKAYADSTPSTRYLDIVR